MTKQFISIAAALSLPLYAYDLHEWGTFTTLSGSDGKLLTGLHIEEEQLPNFVYSHFGMEHGLFNRSQLITTSNSASYFLAPPPVYFPTNAQSRHQQIEVKYDEKTKQFNYSAVGSPRSMIGKGFGSVSVPIKNVTVKMETPVIYFYGGEGQKINVKVGFNGGTISQWYPDRLSGDVPNAIEVTDEQMSDQLRNHLQSIENYTLVDSKARDFGDNYQGSIEWDLELLKADNAYTFKPSQSPTWIYPKVPGANMVKVGNEYEDYLFYRGVGNFELPVTFSVDKEETVHMKNNASEAIPFAFAYEKTGDTIRYKVLGKVDSSAKVSESDWTVAEKNWQPEVFAAVRDGLVEQGLTTHESNGMVKTWWKSYFQHDGLRIFWVVPQKELDKILPLTVSPKPEKSVRVIVGRGDILRPSFEKELVAAIGKRDYYRFSHDRFRLAYKNRLEALIKEPVYQHLSENELTNSSIKITGIKGESRKPSSAYFQKDKDLEVSYLGNLGKWKVLNENELMIGDLHFKLDRKTGIMTAIVDKEKMSDSKWDRYEIQLTKHLN